MDSKAQKLLDTSCNVLKQELLEGHLKWKIAKVAKESGVSRGWIYKYLGTKREDILFHSLSHVMDEFLFMSVEGQKYIAKHGALKAFKKTRLLILKYPEVIIFCLKNTQAQGKYGDLIREKEKRYADVFVRTRNHLQNDFQVEFLRVLINGLALSFFYPKSTVEQLTSDIFSGPFLAWLRTQKDRST